VPRNGFFVAGARFRHNHYGAMDETLTLGQAARACNRSKATISRAVKAGKLPAKAANNGTGWRIAREDLDRLFPPRATSAKPLPAPGYDDALRIEVARLVERVQSLERNLSEAGATVADLRAERDRLLDMLATRRRWWQRFLRW
jgi:excisionase family DNA binding protein